MNEDLIDFYEREKSFTMILLALDPGTEKSGYVVLSRERENQIRIVESCPDIYNHELLKKIKNTTGYNKMAIEMISSYGMPVGATTFNTVLWIGRFLEAFGEEGTELVYRKDVKLHLCGSAIAKDANIRQAIVDKFPATGGGKNPQFGIKKQPGPLYGITSHSISALAVGLTYLKL